MSYKALYRTYRPQDFSGVVGQKHIVSTLQNIISQKKIGHAYLFAGPRGTGKTSVAHIFAKAVNKKTFENVDFKKEELDIIEIDAASHNGVAEVRNIISNINYAPTHNEYKVYIVDEVHMLTKGAFNALLKTLEEPPEHIIFILATTEPHKIPITILSRTQRFNFRRIDDNIIQEQLKKVLTKEQISFDEESIKFISKLAQGGMRDALSIADQAASFGNDNVTFESISQVFGIISIENQIKIFNNAYIGNSKILMHLINKFLNNGVDIEKFALSLLDIMKDYIIYKKTQDYELMSFINMKEVETLKIDIDFAYETIDILMDLINKLRYTAVPRQSMELFMLKIIKEPKEVQQEHFKEENKEDIIAKENKEDIIAKENKEDIIAKENKEDIIAEENKEDIIAKENKEDIIAKENKDINENNFSNISNEQINDNFNQEETQETIVKNSQNSIEINNNVELPTNEINDSREKDMNNLFESEKELFKDVIVNLWLQADRDEIEKNKENWNNIQNFISQEKYKSFVELMINTKIVSAGQKFILIFSEKDYVIDGINLERKSPKFIKFINDLIGKPKLIFTINKDQFKEAKEYYSNLKLENKLPEKKEIEVPKMEIEEKTKEEKLGEDLFGELFSS